MEYVSLPIIALVCYIFSEIYKVIFKDSNGAILSEKIYDFGERVEIPSKPTKDSNSLYSNSVPVS